MPEYKTRGDKCPILQGAHLNSVVSSTSGNEYTMHELGWSESR